MGWSRSKRYEIDGSTLFPSLLSLALIVICIRAEAQPAPSDQSSTREVISNMQEFEKRMGFPKTKNFRKADPNRPAYLLCFSTGLLQLPDSYEGLWPSPVNEKGCQMDGRKHDLFFYRVEAIAGNAKITPALAEATDERKTVVVAHEDFHVAMDSLPAPVAEAGITLVGFLVAAEFAKEQFGEESSQYRNLSQESELFQRKAALIKAYHTRLRLLYESVRRGGTSRAAALAEKQRVFDELGEKCREILPEPHSFNRCPPVFNNAGLAFDMTYANYYPDLYQIYLDHNRSLHEMIEMLKGLVTDSKAVGKHQAI